MTEYLSAQDAVRVVERLGFTVRDWGLLSSALARPSTGFGGVDVYGSVDEKAAALLESVIRNHALLDGNKRLGWTLMVLMLWINGCRHTFTTDTAFEMILAVAQGQSDVQETAAAIAAHRVRR